MARSLFRRIAWFLTVLTIASAHVPSAPLLWQSADLAQLYQAPAVRFTVATGPDYVLNYDNVAYQGKTAQVFAYYSVPASYSGKLPGIVLVHGGAGSADQNWAKQWASWGYAAISIDLNGANVDYGRPWDSDNFGQGEQMPLKDTWYYHAPSAAIRAVSFLRSRPEVDTSRIGLMGISWGGWTTSIVVGVDKRVSFGIPVYGCGFIWEHSAWQVEGPITSPSYINTFDPANYLGGATIPLFWCAGADDYFYPAVSRRKSMRLTHGKNTLTLRQDMPHDGDTPLQTPEIRAYADAICKGTTGLISMKSLKWSADSIWATYEKTANAPDAGSAQLIYTTAADPWTNFNNTTWTAASASVNVPHMKISARVPTNAKVLYLLVTDKNSLLTSTEHVDRTADGATGEIIYSPPTSVSGNGLVRAPTKSGAMRRTAAPLTEGFFSIDGKRAFSQRREADAGRRVLIEASSRGCRVMLEPREMPRSR